MRRRWYPCLVMALALAAAGPVGAQDQGSPEELRKLYGEAIEHLKAAQDRKNELAEENERLKARLAELEQEVSTLRDEAARFAERTWSYRSRLAAWERFLTRHPRLREQWRQFLSVDALDPSNQLPEPSEVTGPLTGP